MNNFIKMILLGITLLALTACGGSSDNSVAPAIEEPTYDRVKIENLQDGYIVSGLNDNGENVTLSFCLDNYNYYSGNGHWNGYYTLNRQRINMFDETPTGGSYRIDTFNGLLEVGEIYTIDFQNDEIIVHSILADSSCLN